MSASTARVCIASSSGYDWRRLGPNPLAWLVAARNYGRRLEYVSLWIAIRLGQHKDQIRNEGT